MSSDLAGVWEVALSDGVHRIEFEHGTTTGKRVIYVDGKVSATGTSSVSIVELVRVGVASIYILISLVESKLFNVTSFPFRTDLHLDYYDF